MSEEVDPPVARSKHEGEGRKTHVGREVEDGGENGTASGVARGEGLKYSIAAGAEVG